ncbi:hypothetical protein V6N12_038698 [Hibiscus sabdariffa]|uniref:Uncharacterized protein n=1 Tax=Hibiscus sabdariffa TaxID=183260 RepID=A0ABR2CAK9_9ROSI
MLLTMAHQTDARRWQCRSFDGGTKLAPRVPVESSLRFEERDGKNEEKKGFTLLAKIGPGNPLHYPDSDPGRTLFDPMRGFRLICEHDSKPRPCGPSGSIPGW